MREEQFLLWLKKQHLEVVNYLNSQGIENPNVIEWPAFIIAPHLAIWNVESRQRIGAKSWWAFSGDFPTDYISAVGISEPREALVALLKQWKAYLPYLLQSKHPPNTLWCQAKDGPMFAKLLSSRILIFDKLVNNRELWIDKKLEFNSSQEYN